jgi:signal transduction histidine kinase
MIRHRLLMVVLLGVTTSALSLLALVKALSSMSRNVRIERARTEVEAELSRMVQGQVGSSTYVGLRAGTTLSEPGLPAEWREPLAATIEEANARAGRVVREVPIDDKTLVLAAEPRAAGYAWTGYLVQPSQFLAPWRWIVLVLAAATGLLVATTVWGVFAFRRSTSSLHATLVALGKDLSTPVPAPRIAELTGIADGIRRMAADLLASRRANERQERLAALGRVAAGVAHEVRNPLASIKLRLDLTAQATDLSPDHRAAVEAASQEIARLDRLVSDLLLLAGKKMGPLRTVDVGSLVRERADAMAPWAARRKVDLRVSGQAAAAIDGASIARAIDNLLRNAIEASPDGAAVDARVSDGGGDLVEITVEDAGTGVEPGRAGELFEPFFTTKAEGTGLGLAISRAIARAHGGDVRYARDGGRTRFVMSLPRAAVVNGGGDVQKDAA